MDSGELEYKIQINSAGHDIMHLTRQRERGREEERETEREREKGDIKLKFP